MISIGFDKNLGYVSLGNIINTFFGAVLWLIIASNLNAVDFGSLNYDIAIATLLTSIGILGFDTTLTAYIAKGTTKMLDESFFLIIVSSFLIMLFLLIIYPSVPVIMLIISMMIFTLVESKNLGEHNFRKYMWLMIFQRIISLISVPLFYFYIGIEAALYGFILSYLLVSYEIYKWFKQIRISISTLIPIKNYFFHSYILGVSKVLPYFFDKLLILPLFGFATVGLYQFGVQVLSIISILSIIFYGYLLPKESKNSNKNSLKIFSKMGLITSTFLTILLIISLPTIILSFFPHFSSAIVPSQIILLSGIPLTLSSIYNSIYMARGHSVNVVIGTIIFISFQSIGIIILGNIYGLIGLSISTTFASIIQCGYLILARGILYK